MDASTVSAHISNIISSIEALRVYEREMNQMASQCEAQINDCYHIIELGKVDCVTISQVTKKMKTLLQHRRFYKEQRIIASNTLVHTGKINTALLEAELKKSQERQDRYTNETSLAVQRILSSL